MKETTSSKLSLFIVRDQKVISDSDLALLYEVQTKVILQAMKRNIERFPSEFAFLLSYQKVIRLRSQIVTSNIGGGGRRNNPYAFTEHGVAMLSAVLKSERAVKVSIEIIRMFVKLRQLVLSDGGLAKRVENLEEKTDSHARAIIGIICELEEPIESERQKIGFSVEEGVAGYADY